MEAVASSLMLTRPPYHEFSFSESFCRGRLARVACAFPVAGFAEIGGRHCGASFETAIRGWRLQPENQRGRRETVFFAGAADRIVMDWRNAACLLRPAAARGAIAREKVD